MRMYSEKAGLNILSFHHVGLLVQSIEDSMQQYVQLFGSKNISQLFNISSQQVKVCFVKIAEDSFIELVQPLSETSSVYKLLRKKISYYHTAYKVKDIVYAVQKLEELNYKPLEFFNSEAFENKRCIFLFAPDASLIELIED